MTLYSRMLSGDTKDVNAEQQKIRDQNAKRLKQNVLLGELKEIEGLLPLVIPDDKTDDIPYDTVRKSKFLTDIDVSQLQTHVQLTQEKTRQIQQQQSIQIQQTLHVEVKEQALPVIGFNDLIRIDSNDGALRETRSDEGAVEAILEIVHHGSYGDYRRNKVFQYPLEWEDSSISVFKKLPREIITVFKKIAGSHSSKTHSVSYLKRAAAKHIVQHTSEFVAGVNIFNVPEGYVAKITSGRGVNEHEYKVPENPRLTLDYDPINASRQINPLTVRFIPEPQPLKIVGTPEQFNVTNRWAFDNLQRIPLAESENDLLLQTKESARNDLFSIMEGDNPELGRSLIQKYGRLFELFLHNDLVGCFEIVYAFHCDGLASFLEKLQKLYNKDNGVSFQFFQKSFLRYSPNWLEFMSSEKLAAIDDLIEMEACYRNWWNPISVSHAQSCGWTDLVDAMHAFDYFWTELYALGRKRLPAGQELMVPEYPLNEMGVSHLKVVLDRVLFVLAHVRDMQAQLNYLEGINFNSSDVVYAILHDHYQFISRDMNLSQEVSALYSGASYVSRSVARDDATLVVTRADLVNCRDRDHSPYRWLYYNYFGLRNATISYKAFHLGIDKIATKLQHRSYARDTLCLIFTLSATHERGCDERDCMESLDAFLQLFESTSDAYLFFMLPKLRDFTERCPWLKLTEYYLLAILLLHGSRETEETLNELLIIYQVYFVERLVAEKGRIKEFVNPENLNKLIPAKGVQFDVISFISRVSEHLSFLSVDDRLYLSGMLRHVFFPSNESEESYKQYIGEMALFADTVTQQQNNWPSSVAEMVKILVGLRQAGDRTISLTTINKLLKQVLAHYHSGNRFPMGLIRAYVSVGDRLADVKEDHLSLEKIVTLARWSEEQKSVMLQISLIASAYEINLDKFINILDEQLSDSRLLKTENSIILLKTILQNVDSQRNTELTLANALTLLDLLRTSADAHLQEHVFAFLHEYPFIFNIILTGFSKIPTEEKSPENTKEKRKLIFEIIVRSYQTNTIQALEYVSIVDELRKQKIEILRALLSLNPAPSGATLLIACKDHAIQQFIANPFADHYQYRDLKAQFSVERALPVINAIVDMGSQSVLSFESRKELYRQFSLVNAFGYDEKYFIATRMEGGNLRRLAAKDLTDAEIRDIATDCKQLVNDEKRNADDKNTARLVFLSVAREAMVRATYETLTDAKGIMPYSTQVICVLNVLMQKSNAMLEVMTGEGKSVTIALLAAMFWLEGFAFDVSTDNIELAAREAQMFNDYFQLLSIPCRKLPLTSQSDPDDYCYQGVNYSDTAQAALFAVKMYLDPKCRDTFRQRKAALCLDEADSPIYDDSTHYRFAVYLHSEDFTWVYRPMYQFILTETFRDKSATVRQDLQNAYAFIQLKAKELNIDIKTIKSITAPQLNTWIEAAIAASLLRENYHFVNRQEHRDGQLVSFARIIANHRVSSAAEWSNGVHQLLHTILNEKKKKLGLPPFVIEPETVPVASISSKVFIDQYPEAGSLVCLTATTGSPQEREEASNKYDLSIHQMPSHYPNRRVVKPTIIAANMIEYKKAIVDEIKSAIWQTDRWAVWRDGKPQPIVIFCKDIETSRQFYHFLRREIAKDEAISTTMHWQLYNAAETYIDDQRDISATEPQVVARAGVSGWITVTAPLVTRGVDYKPRYFMENKKQNHIDGLYTIQIFMATERRDKQTSGRGARQGFPSSSRVILNQEDYPGMDLYAIHYLPSDHEQNERLLREAQADIKHYFFENYLQVCEKVSDPVAFRKAWSQCLQQIDLDWQQIVCDKELISQNSSLMTDATDELIHKICMHWSIFAGQYLSLNLADVKHALNKLDHHFITMSSLENGRPREVVESDISLDRAYLAAYPPFVFNNPDREKLLWKTTVEIALRRFEGANWKYLTSTLEELIRALKIRLNSQPSYLAVISHFKMTIEEVKSVLINTVSNEFFGVKNPYIAIIEEVKQLFEDSHKIVTGNQNKPANNPTQNTTTLYESAIIDNDYYSIQKVIFN